MGFGHAVGELEDVVPELRIAHARAPVLHCLEARDGRHGVAADLRADGRHVVKRIAETSHADGAERHIIVISHHARLLRAVLHELVVQLVELGSVRIEPRSLRGVRGTAHGAVRVFFVRGQLADRPFFALKLDERRGIQLLIFRGKGVFLRHQVQHFGRLGLDVEFHLFERQRTERFLEFRAERALHHRAGHGLLGVGESGAVLVPELIFRLIELVPRVDRVADRRQRRLRAGVAGQSLGLSVLLQLLGRIGRLRNGLCDLPVLTADVGNVRALVRKFRTFHNCSSEFNKFRFLYYTISSQKKTEPRRKPRLCKENAYLSMPK